MAIVGSFGCNGCGVTLVTMEWREGRRMLVVSCYCSGELEIDVDAVLKLFGGETQSSFIDGQVILLAEPRRPQ